MLAMAAPTTGVRAELGREGGIGRPGAPLRCHRALAAHHGTPPTGEYPEAARAAGLSPGACQAMALALSGALAGAAGAYLSLGYVSWFGVDMTAGRGFVALAAAVMGDGSAWGAAAAVALIALAETSAIALGAFGLPSELIRAIPYLLPVIALVLYSLRRRRHAGRST